MKKFIGVLLAVLLLCSLLAGCAAGTASSGTASDSAASASEPAAASASQSAEPVELTFYAFGFQALVNLPGYESQTQNLGDAYQLMISDFEKQYPNVTINLVTINPAGGGTEQLDVDLASGETPNIYYDSLLRISKYNGLGYLLNMKDYVDPAVLSGFTPGSVETDNLFYMPTGSSPMCLCVNKDLFEQIGASDLLPAADDRNWTTDQFLAALQAVKDAKLDGVYPTILWAANQSGDACNMSYLWGFGARFFADGDYSKVVLNSQEGYDALGFLNQISADGLAVPGAAGLNDDDMWAMWQNGQVAVTGGYPYLEDLANQAEKPFETYFVNYPHVEGQPNSPVAPDTHAVAVFASDSEAENEMACKFAEFLVSSKWAVTISQALGDMTVLSSLDGQLKMSEEYTAAQKLMNDCGIISYGPACSKWSDLRPMFASEMQAMYGGTKTPQQAADDFTAEANQVLSD